ncbi:SIR2 family protein [Enterococcus casseliflavus]|uniref:SIR2 family protein n=1 Tax=Enterococcus casseliflavus TaxID=37734 RepID=UPI0022FD3F83|nr:SIR2 family protein [Enterococcus casseliflavus]WBY93704.1 SIR2 family protein [Enterococcus casseliflavus]
MSANESNLNEKSNSTSKVNSYNPKDKYSRMIEKLAEAETKRKLVVFIGAGVSRLQGYPNWDGYVDHLIKYWQFNIQSLMGQEKVPRETILVFDKIAAGNYSNKRKIDLVHQVIKDLLKDNFEQHKLDFEKFYFDEVVSFDPENSILASLSDLDAIFITPNYDLEIENHLRRKRKNISPIPNLKRFNNSIMDHSMGPILHIHGTAKSDPNWLINSSAAYSRQYFRDRRYFEALIDWFKLNKPVVLFVGVSLEEDELLSLLIEENKNYALMKTDADTEVKVDNQLRKYTELFFEQENHTEIFWYGDSFNDLPQVVKQIVIDIKEKNQSPIQDRFWQILTKLETPNEVYIDTLNTMVNDHLYHQTLYEFFGHILQNNDKNLIEKALENSLKSEIILCESTYVPESLWEIFDEKYDELDKTQVALVQKLYIQKSFDPRYTSAYNIFNKIFTDHDMRAQAINSLSNFEYLPMTDYFGNPEIAAQWLVTQFLKGQSYDHVYIPNEETVKFDFRPETIHQLHSILDNEPYNTYYPYPIDKMVDRGILGVFFQALKDNRLFINQCNMIDCFPDELLEIKYVQKLLVYLSMSLELPDDLTRRLIEKIDFTDKFFGSNLNDFIKANKAVIESLHIQYEDEYKDTIKEFEPFVIESFITSNDVLQKDEQDIISILLTNKDYFDNRYHESTDSFKTLEATIDFIFRSLQEDNDISVKLKKIFTDHADELFIQYESLYLKIAIDENIDPTLSAEARSIFLKNIDRNKYSANYDTFFSNLLVRNDKSDENLSGFFLKIDTSKLTYLETEGDLKDFIEFANTELGSYTWNLIKLVRLNKVDSEIAKNKIRQISVIEMRNFAEGALLEYYNMDELNITKNTFLGFCYSPSYKNSKEIFPRFKSIVSQLFENNTIPDHLERIPFLVALYEIDPNTIEIVPNNKFRFMLDIIFINDDAFKFQKEWIEWIIENDPDGTSLNELAYIFSLEKISLSKLHKFMDWSEDFLRKGVSKTSLSIFIHKLKEDEISVERQVFLDLVFKLLKNKRVRTDLYFAEEIEKLMVFLQKEQKLDLLSIQYVKNNLTPLEKERLKSKI